MPFLKRVPPDPLRNHSMCDRPSSGNENFFGKGSIWVCDKCNKVWKFNGVIGDPREGEYDVWKEVLPGRAAIHENEYVISKQSL